MKKWWFLDEICASTLTALCTVIGTGRDAPPHLDASPMAKGYQAWGAGESPADGVLRLATWINTP
jgi:hypothetical protein